MRPEAWAGITTHAATQHGLVSREQVLGCGSSVRTLERAVARGLLVPVRKEVYLVAGAHESPGRMLTAACLAAGPRAVASHRAAAGLHRFPGILPGAVELMIAGGLGRKLQGVTCHSGATLVPADVVKVDGFHVTSPARTVIDLAAHLSPHLLARIVDFCCRRRLCTLDDLDVRLAQLGRRNGSARLERLLADRVGGESDLEARWLRVLRRAGVDPPALQHQVVAGGRVLILDFAWPDQRVGIEVDGWSAHRHRSAWDHDHDKVNAYLEAGWRVLFVTSNTAPGAVIRQLRALISPQAANRWRRSAK